jgi:hypothetical protein
VYISGLPSDQLPRNHKKQKKITNKFIVQE